MSPRSSTSPKLHLPIAESRRARYLQLGVFLAALAAIAVIALEGRAALAALLAIPLFCSLPKLIGQPQIGCVLAWRAGRWSLDRGAGFQAITLAAGCRVTPWVVIVCWLSLIHI